MLILNPNAFRALARGLFFRVDAETAHAVSAAALRQHWLWQRLAPLLSVRDPALRTELAGLPLHNPVGVAAGYDKNCEMLPSLAALGFGYVTGGTVTLQPRPGNPSPRVLRYEEDESLINALGFPNWGVDYAVSRLRRDRGRTGDTPVVVSVSGVTPEEVVACHRAVEPHCDAVEVNVSSPNTQGVRVFQQPDALTDLLDRINERRSKPLFVKLPPYAPGRPEDDGARQRVLALAVVCEHLGVDGLTVANTWPARDSRLAVGVRRGQRQGGVRRHAADGGGRQGRGRPAPRHQRLRRHLVRRGRLRRPARGRYDRTALHRHGLPRPGNRQGD